ncbi:MAG: ComEC/Rec2 family competence protein, partial [Actinomycetota bacterium]
GDAVLLREPGGRTMLVDGGPDPRRILKRLRAHGVRRLDVVVLTHSHADHVDGLVAAIDRYPVGVALDAGEEPGEGSGPRYPGYLARLRARRIQRRIVRAGAAFAFGDARVDVLGPAELFAGTDSDPNNNSVVLRVSYGPACALLTGDVQEEAQDALLSSNTPALRCAVLKAPHHGSRRVLREFYEATRSRYAFVCVGPNDYGHPAIGTVRMMAELGMRVFRTDRDGDAGITIAPDGTLQPSAVRTRAA